MLRVGHVYPEEITTLLRKEYQQSTMCHVERYNRKNVKFNVQEILTPQLRHRPMSYIVKPNEWLCDCDMFQALRLPCSHVIVVCAYCHLQLTTFVIPVYNLHNILKAYEVQFHPVQNKDFFITLHGSKFVTWPTHAKKGISKTNYYL